MHRPFDFSITHTDTTAHTVVGSACLDGGERRETGRIHFWMPTTSANPTRRNGIAEAPKI